VGKSSTCCCVFRTCVNDESVQDAKLDFDICDTFSSTNQAKKATPYKLLNQIGVAQLYVINFVINKVVDSPDIFSKHFNYI